MTMVKLALCLILLSGCTQGSTYTPNPDDIDGPPAPVSSPGEYIPRLDDWVPNPPIVEPEGVPNPPIVEPEA